MNRIHPGVQFLRRPQIVGTQVSKRSPSDEVPLTFSQRSWCAAWGIGTAPGPHAVWPVRLSGPLDIESLRRSIASLVRRHESLRTKITNVNGVVRQEVDDSRAYELEVLDLTHLFGHDREKKSHEILTTAATERIDVAVDPLFSAKLLRLEAEEHLLIVGIDHLVMDVVSLSILRRDIWELYRQIADDLPQSLPNVPIQFSDYAVWQDKNHAQWMKAHGNYWQERLAGAQRVTSIARDSAAMSLESKWHHSKILFDEELTARFRELSRRNRTTLPATILSIYVASLLLWCNAKDIVVPFVSMGRPSPDLENTVGFFGSFLFLRVELLEDDTLLELLKRTVREYATAMKHHDYGWISAQTPRPEFAENPAFNWFPADFDFSSEMRIRSAKTQQELKIQEVNWDFMPSNFNFWSEPQIPLRVLERAQGLVVEMVYHGSSARESTVKRFLENVRLIADALVTDPNKKLMSVPCLR